MSIKFPWQKKSTSNGWISIYCHSNGLEAVHLLCSADKKQRPKVLNAWHIEKTNANTDYADLLEQFVAVNKNNNSIKNQRISLVLSADLYDCRLAQIPRSTPEKEIADTLRWKLNDLIDENFPAYNAAVDWFPSADMAPSSDEKDVYVFAARHDDIAAIMEIFQEAQLDLAAIDVEEIAQRNISPFFSDIENRPSLVLCNTGKRSLLTLVHKGEIYGQSRIDLTAAMPSEEAVDDRMTTQLQRTIDGLERKVSKLNAALGDLYCVADNAKELANRLSRFYFSLDVKTDISDRISNAFDFVPLNQNYPKNFYAEHNRSMRHKLFFALGSALRELDEFEEIRLKELEKASKASGGNKTAKSKHRIGKI